MSSWGPSSSPWDVEDVNAGEREAHETLFICVFPHPEKAALAPGHAPQTCVATELPPKKKVLNPLKTDTAR